MFVVENWGWPQWAFVVIPLLSISISAAQSGKEETHSSFGVFLVAKVIQAIVLICGGFYQNIGWPQVVWIVILAINIGLAYRLSGQKYQESLLRTLIDSAITMFLLIMGGFFA